MKRSKLIHRSFYRLMFWGALLVLMAGLFLTGRGEVAYAQLPTPRPSRVAANTIVSVSPSSPSVSQGEQFDIIVSISTTPEDMTTGAQFQLVFDPSYIEILGFTEGNFFKDWAAANGIETIVVPEPTADNVAGVLPTVAISLLGYLPEDVTQRPSGSGSLLILHAKAKDRQGSSELIFEDVVVSDFPVSSRADIQSYEGVKTQNGVVTIGGAPIQNTPQAQAVPTATKPAVLVQKPTVAVITPQGALAETESESASGFGAAWLLGIPVIGAIVIGIVVIFLSRRK